MIKLIDKSGGIFVLRIMIHAVNTITVSDLKTKIDEFINENTIEKLILDISNVEIITSSGIGLFLFMNKNLSGNLRLARPHPDVFKVLELTQATTLLKTFDTLEDAQTSFTE